MFRPLLHPASIGMLMNVIIKKDWLLFGVEGLGLAEVLPWDVGPTGWYRHYRQYFNAAVGDDGLISSGEKTKKRPAVSG